MTLELDNDARVESENDKTILMDFTNQDGDAGDGVSHRGGYRFGANTVPESGSDFKLVQLVTACEQKGAS